MLALKCKIIVLNAWFMTLGVHTEEKRIFWPTGHMSFPLLMESSRPEVHYVFCDSLHTPNIFLSSCTHTNKSSLQGLISDLGTHSTTSPTQVIHTISWKPLIVLCPVAEWAWDRVLSLLVWSIWQKWEKLGFNDFCSTVRKNEVSPRLFADKTIEKAHAPMINGPTLGSL